MSLLNNNSDEQSSITSEDVEAAVNAMMNTKLTSAVSKPVLPSKDALLYDNEICTMLGMTRETGMCIRHPNITIYESFESTTKKESVVHTCRICSSETKAGGVRQRKSFAYAIHQIQQIHGNKEAWNHYKEQTWGLEDVIEETGTGGGGGKGKGNGNSNSNSNAANPHNFDIDNDDADEEEKKDVLSESIVFVADKNQAKDTIHTKHLRPSAMLLPSGMPKVNWTRQVLQRAEQVAEWKCAHMNVEMENLRKEMEKLKQELSKSQQTAVKREAELKAVVQKQQTEMEALQEKCEKQERHINKELRMIKTIAMKRASSRGSMMAESSTTNGGNSTNRKPNEIDMFSPVSPVPSNASGDAPMRKPSRKISEQAVNIHEIHSPTTTAATSDTTGASVINNLVPIRQMPGKQTRLSSLTLTDVSAFQQRNSASDSMEGNESSGAISFTNLHHSSTNHTMMKSQSALEQYNEDKSPPSQPQRLPSHETGVTNMSDLTTSLAATEFLTGVNHDTSITFIAPTEDAKQPLDIHSTTPSSVLTGSSRKKYISLVVNQEATPSIDEGFEEEEEENTSTNSNSEKLDPVVSHPVSPKRETRDQHQKRNQKRNENNDQPHRRARSDFTPEMRTQRKQHIKNNRSHSEHEISFFPTESEAAATPLPPPPPPPMPDTSKHGTPHPRHHLLHGTPSSTLSKSQEIEFDASRDFQHEDVDKRHQSMMKMKFDSKLLMDASAALADPLNTPITHGSFRKSLLHKGSPAHLRSKSNSSSSSLQLSQSSSSQSRSKSQRLKVTIAPQHKEINFSAGVAAAASSHNIRVDRDSIKEKTQEEIMNEKIFGNIEKATPENEANDEYDYFEDLPSDLGLTKEGYLQVRHSVNLSPVSAITTGSMSYLMDHGMGAFDGMDDDEDEDGPRKGLHQAGFAKRLPMEEDFDSEDDDDYEDDDENGNENDNDNDGRDDRKDSNNIDGDADAGAAADGDDDPDTNDDADDGPDVDTGAQNEPTTENNDDASDGDDGNGSYDDETADTSRLPPPVKMTSMHSPQPSHGSLSHGMSPPVQLKSAHADHGEVLYMPQEEPQSVTIVKPTAQKPPLTEPSSSVPPVQLRALSEGFNKQGQSMRARSARSTVATLYVENEIVQDKYGDGGTYSGTISRDDRLPHGNGKMAYDNERQYDGEWRKGRWHGIGKWVNPNGDCYEGTFVYDARHGRGTYTWKNGNVYKGDFHEDKRQGKGIFNFANGNVYEGEFVNGVFEGQGKYSFEGGFYEGGWKGGRYHNHGYLKFADGSSYTGEFVDGVAHGQGEEKSADGTMRAGYWENGRPVSGPL